MNQSRNQNRNFESRAQHINFAVMHPKLEHAQIRKLFVIWIWQIRLYKLHIYMVHMQEQDFMLGTFSSMYIVHSNFVRTAATQRIDFLQFWIRPSLT